MYGRTLEMESSSPNKTSLFFPAQVSEVFQAVFEENEKVASRGQTKPPFFLAVGDLELCRQAFAFVIKRNAVRNSQRLMF